MYRIYGHNHHKIALLKIDEKNENLYLLLEDGSIIIKHVNNLTKPEICLYYEDEEKITELFIDAKNSLLFVGTRNGLLRVHSLAIEKFSINDYAEIGITNC